MDTTRPLPRACWCSVNGALMFAVVPDDSYGAHARRRRRSDARDAAAVMLQRVIDESRESRDLKSLLIGALVALGAGAGHAGADVAAAQGCAGASRWLLTGKTLARCRSARRVGGVEAVRREAVSRVEQMPLNLVHWFAAAAELVDERPSLALP